MVHIVLVRHGESHANASGILAGQLPDIALTDNGAEQIRRLIEVFPWRRVDEVRFSPVQRCRETTEVLLEGIEAAVVRPAPEFVEVDYGDWSGRKLAELKALPEWIEVAQRPSAMIFPGGETLSAAAHRAVTGIGSFVSELRSQQSAPSPETMPVGLVVAHGDIIKAVLAAALGMPLDEFQRIAVAPGSYSVVSYPLQGHPTVTAMSVTAGGRPGQPGVLGGGA